MKKNTNEDSKMQAESASQVLDGILKEGARKLLQIAIEKEVAEYIQQNRHLVDERGHKMVVRNGFLPGRDLQTGLGSLPIKQPRVLDRRPNKKFSSNILPPYLRKTPEISALLPALYLRGISTGDFHMALEAILGPKAPGLSAGTIVRLKNTWQKEYETWKKQSLADKHYVYVWADGVYFNVRLDDERTCLLIIVGATPEGKKELIAVHDGYRESKLSWLEILRDLKTRGLSKAPALAIGDGSLGFWAALREEFSETREQRCWVHKTANILDKLPRGMQSKAKSGLHEIYLSETKEKAFAAFKAFLKMYEAKYSKACECLAKDKDALMAFYDFPAEQWVHIRTTNPIESTFATVRLRTKRTKGCGSRIATLTMVFKLAKEAEKRWRRLKGHELIFKLTEGVRFVNGEMKEAA